MKRLFIVLIKYIPIIQMVGMLFNNILYCFSNIYIISYLYVEKQDNKIFWKSMRKLHESIKGAHFDEEYAKWQVSTMYHTADNGKICKGEIYNYDCAKNVFDKYVRNINSSITVWDVYVAINAQYHDYIRLYSEWFRNINKNELDNKIIESAITFYFKDEDFGSTKTWNYFKTAN